MVTPDQVLLITGLLLIISVLVSKTAGRVGIPALILFLLVGVLAGSEGPGGIAFEDHASAQFLGVVALVLILFAGGLDTRWHELRVVLLPGVLLSTLGVAITATALGLFLHFAMGLPLLFALLFGTVLSSTDASAVFAVLRSRNVSFKGRLAPMLELESGSNDPMAVLLTLAVTGLLVDHGADWSAFGFGLSLGIQLVTGLLIGLAGGRGIVWLINRVKLPNAGLYPVLSLASILALYGGTTFIHGNGFLATYVAGLVLANARFMHKGSLTRYHDALAWLMQVSMFLVLGLLVFPSHLVPVAGMGLATAACLIFVARPIAVFACLTPLRVPWREQVLVSWVGLRGAVPIILATFPLLAGVADAELLFNVVFFVVVASVLVQGPTIQPLARLLGLDAPKPESTPYPLIFEPTPTSTNDMFEVAVPAGSFLEGKRIAELNLPEGALVVLISRGAEFIIPRGKMIIQPFDKLLILSDEHARGAVMQQLQTPPT